MTYSHLNVQHWDLQKSSAKSVSSLSGDQCISLWPCIKLYILIEPWSVWTLWFGGSGSWGCPRLEINWRKKTGIQFGQPSMHFTIHDVYFSNCSGYQTLCHHSFLHDKIDSQASRIAGIRTMSAADHLDIRNPGGSSWGILGIWGSGSHAMNYCSEMFFLANQFIDWISCHFWRVRYMQAVQWVEFYAGLGNLSTMMRASDYTSLRFDLMDNTKPRYRSSNFMDMSHQSGFGFLVNRECCFKLICILVTNKFHPHPFPAKTCPIPSEYSQGSPFWHCCGVSKMTSPVIWASNAQAFRRWTWVHQTVQHVLRWGMCYMHQWIWRTVC